MDDEDTLDAVVAVVAVVAVAAVEGWSQSKLPDIAVSEVVAAAEVAGDQISV